MPLKTARNALIIGVVLFYCVFSVIALNGVYHGFLDEKYQDRKLSIDLICDGIEMNGLPDGYERILAALSARLDATGGTYCEAYDRGLNGLSERTPLFDGHPYRPVEDTELLAKIRAYDRAEAVSAHVVEGVTNHAMRVYFRWVGDVVIVLGVSEFTLETNVTGLIQTGVTAFVIAAAAAFVLHIAAAWVERGNRSCRRTPS
jgi:hypothetical protein